MRVILVGTPDERRRLRARVPPGIEILGEAPTASVARGMTIECDAVLSPAPHDAFSEDDSPAEALTPRELEVLSLMVEGLSNKVIASRLEISDQTVKFHVASICGKLDAANRTDAVRRGIARGLVAL